MKRVRLALLTATTLMAGVAGSAATAATAAAENGDRVELRRALDGIVDAGAVGALVEVRDRHHVWRDASGVKRLDSNRPVPVQSTFRAGSITKTFVATVALQLVDAGKLRLGDTVEEWLPGVVPAGEDITVRHLLGHTSGLPDVIQTLTLPPSPDFLKYRSRTWTADELIRRALANPPTFQPPGSNFDYSNTNYVLLGEILEKATGRSYAELIERRIVRPLKLRDTTLPGTSRRIPGPHPHGYVPILRRDKMRLVDFTNMNPSLFGAGGEIISTTTDLNRFFNALLDGRLLPADLLKKMKTPGVDKGVYGLGLFLKETSCGVRLYGNNGDALTYHSWSYSTQDTRRQATIALTPNYRGDLDDAIDAYLDAVFCD